MSKRVLPLLFALTLLPVTGIHAGEDEGRTPGGPVRWALDLASDSKGSGQVADIDGDGKLEVVFGTYFGDAHLYAVNVEDGSVLWKHASAGGPFDASVAIADLDGEPGLEIVASDSASGRTWCLDGQGTVRWELKLPSGTDSPPAVGDLDGDGKPELVIGTMWRRGGVGRVCAIDPRKPRILWQVDVKGCVQSEPALVDLDGDGNLDVVVTSWRGDRGVHALSGLDGTSLWTFTTAGTDKSMGMYHGVTVVETEAGPRLFTATCEGDVYALDAKGKVLWQKHFDDYLFSPTTAADFDGDGTLELFVAGRKAYLLRLADGEPQWERSLGGFIGRGGAAVDLDADGSAEIVLSAGTTVYVLDGATGKTRLEHDLAQDPEDRLEKISSAPVVWSEPDGLRLFVVCGRGYSGELKGENRGRAQAIFLGRGKGQWSTFRGNLRRTGTRRAP